MAENSKIEWCHHTFNPWIGCTKVSPGCANCYAENQDSRWKHTAEGWGKGKPRKRTSEANWKKPLQWNKQAKKEGVRYRVFCASLADWLDDEIPIEWLVDLLSLIRETPHLDWLLLSKRLENWKERIGDAAFYARTNGGDMSMFCEWGHGKPPQNVWLGTSVEDQKRADERIPHLISIPAKVRFLSCEPLLGPVDVFHTAIPERIHQDDGLNGDIHWVIAGGESGPNARPMHPDWVRSLKDQCEGMASFLFKQWGAHDEHGNRVGKSKAGRILDGREWNEFPDLLEKKDREEGISNE